MTATKWLRVIVAQETVFQWNLSRFSLLFPHCIFLTESDVRDQQEWNLTLESRVSVSVMAILNQLSSTPTTLPSLHQLQQHHQELREAGHYLRIELLEELAAIAEASLCTHQSPLLTDETCLVRAWPKYVTSLLESDTHTLHTLIQYTVAYPHLFRYLLLFCCGKLDLNNPALFERIAERIMDIDSMEAFDVLTKPKDTTRLFGKACKKGATNIAHACAPRTTTPLWSEHGSAVLESGESSLLHILLSSPGPRPSDHDLFKEIMKNPAWRYADTVAYLILARNVNPQTLEQAALLWASGDEQCDLLSRLLSHPNIHVSAYGNAALLTTIRLNRIHAFQLLASCKRLEWNENARQVLDACLAAPSQIYLDRFLSHVSIPLWSTVRGPDQTATTIPV